MPQTGNGATKSVYNPSKASEEQGIALVNHSLEELDFVHWIRCYHEDAPIEPAYGRGGQKVKELLAHWEKHYQMDLSRNEIGSPHPIKTRDHEKSVHQACLVIPSLYVITGGHAIGNSSTKAARAYARELDNLDATLKKERKGDLMIFSKDDLINVVYPHEDALVNFAAIIDFNVTRITIDIGSVTRQFWTNQKCVK
ncbi:hypothetical protein NE237_003252 [Protea cynaroides]|uniref:Uncharacterized protein n=1 Tax=Protea cynaroides TaxID=273540 RepID=A0A9Q0QSE5_9MAGN|nr:hypothetical protein NE237_003252 [Protea cynaroides]